MTEQNVRRLNPTTFNRAIDWPLGLAVAAGLTATAWVARLLLGRIDGLAAPPFDLGFFQQIVWSVGHSGQWTSSFHQGSFLGLHFSPVLVVPALVERLIWNDVRVLSLFHAVAVGLLVPAAFLFVRAALRPSRAAGAVAAALTLGIPVWGTLQEVIRSDFHPETAGVVFALLAGWAGLSGRPRTLWLFAILAMVTREDLAYAVGVVGLVVAARGRGDLRRHGRIMAAVAVTWAIVVFGLVMPGIRGGGASDTASYYAWLGGGLGVLTAPFTMTDRVVAALTRPVPWFVVAGMVAPLLGLPLVRLRWAALILPPLVALLLSSHIWQANLSLHYSLILIVPVLAAASMGGRRMIGAATRIGRRRRRASARDRATPALRLPATAARIRPLGLLGGLLLTATATATALAGAWIQGSVPPFDGGEVAFRDRPASLARLERVAADVPALAPLVTDEGLVAPLARRPTIRWVVLGAAPSPDDYVLLDRDAWSSRSWGSRGREQLFAAIVASDRPMLADDGRFVLWGPVSGGGAQ